MVSAYLNQIVTAVPDHDVHGRFISYAPRFLAPERAALFRRMAQRAQIDHRYSFLQPHDGDDELDAGGFYTRGKFPDTQRRMEFYEKHALTLARRALDPLDLAGVTHLIVTTCTGFYAPGLDLQIVAHYGLRASVERTVVGFMGCYAALNALKLARHIVRSEPAARVVILNLELCTLHLQENGTLEEMLSFLIFADGCSAAVVTAEPKGIELQAFTSTLMPDSGDQITWHIGELGFDMNLSGRVPGTIAAGLPGSLDAMLCGARRENIEHWAIHPGGRTILDAVREGAELDETQLATSRGVLRRFGNMSSASIMFVLDDIMRSARRGGEGCAMAFGPGLTVESMRFTSEAA